IVDHGGDALLYPDFQAVLPITNQQDGRCHPTAVKSRGIGVINRINLSRVKMLSSTQILICIAHFPYIVRLPSPKLRLLEASTPNGAASSAKCRRHGSTTCGGWCAPSGYGEQNSDRQCDPPESADGMPGKDSARSSPS